MIDLDFYIPVKDGEKYIAACLDSIFSQTLQPRSVTIYLHTPCLDRTAEIASKYPVTIRNVNVRLSDVRNIALNELTSEWIGSCDADVVLAKDWIEKLWAKKDDGYTILAGNTQERIQTFGDLCRSLLSPHNWGNYDVDNPYNFAPDMIAKRKRFLEIGGYCSGLNNYEDADICQRLKLEGDRFYYVASAQATHIREDDYASWLTQRWNHSFPRQKHLFESAEGLKQRLLNNIALTSVLVQKLIGRKEFSEDALQVLQMPLNHFNKDVEYIQKSKVLEMSKIPLDFFVKHYTTFLKKSYEAFFSIDLNSQQSPNTYAFNDQAWNEKILFVAGQAKTLFQINLDSTPPMDIADYVSKPLPSSGIVYSRQKIFPSSAPLYTCKDLTEVLASQKAHLLWTETFQGSTIVGYAK